MNRRGVLLSGASLCCFGVVARARENADPLSGDRFKIGDEEYLLSDVIAPSQYVLGNGPEAHFHQSRNLLGQFLESADFVLNETGKPNRWRVQPVVVTQSEGARTAQEVLVEQGAVRVAPKTEDTDFIDRLLQLETVARDARKGLWALDAYRVHDAADASGAIGAYSLVEGVVAEASERRGRAYLNFGDDYKTDFTGGARSFYVRRWRKAGFEWMDLAGRRVRVRGFAEYINGPSIDLTHLRQIEILE